MEIEMNAIEKDSKLSLVISKEYGLSLWSILITVWAPVILNVVMFFIQLSVAGQGEESYGKLILNAAIVTAVAVALSAVLFVLNVKRYKAAKEYGALSLGRAILDALFPALLMTVPLSAMNYAFIHMCKLNIDGFAGHSGGAEIFMPLICYLILILPAILVQAFSRGKTERRLMSMMTPDDKTEL